MQKIHYCTWCIQCVQPSVSFLTLQDAFFFFPKSASYTLFPYTNCLTLIVCVPWRQQLNCNHLTIKEFKDEHIISRMKTTAKLSHVLQKMKVGPSGSDYRIRSQTTWKLYSLRVGVRSVLGKGETWFHQVCSEEMNASELLMKHRKSTNVIKTVLDKTSGWV